MKTWALFFACALSAFVARAERVIDVSDGDTITVLNEENKQMRVRLWGIDAPEKKQSYGQAARRHLAEHIAGKDVRLEIRGKDRYGRVLAVVWLGDENENLLQVRDGFAWHYSQYAKKATEYADAEKCAREHHWGLWQDASPTPPWEFRRRKRKKN